MTHPRSDEFTALIGTQFQVVGAQMEVTLSAATSPQDGVLSLVFRSPSLTVMPQGTYELATDATREAIFLVPISADDNGVEYEAIFA